MKKDTLTWEHIFDASITELEQLFVEAMPHTPKSIYIQAILYYLKGATNSLESLWEQNESFIDEMEIKAMISLRLKIKTKNISESELLRLENDALSFSDIWRGELFFSIGIAWGQMGKHTQAINAFYNSYLLYLKYGVIRKGLKAYLNAISAYENANPNHLTLSNFWYFIKVANQTEGHDNLGVAHLNLSYQFQKIGCLKSATEQITHALHFLKNDLGSLQYYLALCQKFELDCAQGNFDYGNFEIIKDSSHNQIKEVAHYLEKRYLSNETSKKININHHNLPTAWKNRAFDFSYGSERFSSSEEQLIFFLSDFPKTLDEIIQHLYPEDLSEANHLYAKVRSLIHRINRKKNLLIKKQKTNTFHLANNKIFDEIILTKYESDLISSVNQLH